jgi:hypothetical protein
MFWLSAQPLGNFPVLQIAYAGKSGPVDAYKILATYYSAASTSSVVAEVSVEGIFSATKRSDLDSNTIQSVASLPGGFVVGILPDAIVAASKCGVRLRGFVRGPLTGAGVYTFTVALNVRSTSTKQIVRAAKCSEILLTPLTAGRHGSYTCMDR